MSNDHRFRLALDDLIPGGGNEVVLFNDSALREVVLEAPAAPLEIGRTAHHVTRDGIDVTGFCYLRFASGIVLYHDPDTTVQVETPAG